MFRVDWHSSALDEIAVIWTGADSNLRKTIAAAGHAINQRLRADAPNDGESRPGGRRLTFAAPLAVIFQVDAAAMTATVLHVRLFRRRNPH